ncbi:PREDICTED: subtilisin-like protease SBT1.7 [Erythranthe guttata]|nr:PREDICTED: subtilisin-like protease SBT1.7 [Erythranthe guttata]|eukprot:XP_012846775.1 PREDICTED: subtilisin-like protease SBT1.7 [Erythranthe guttata]
MNYIVPFLSLFFVFIIQLSSATANGFCLQTYIVHVDLPDSQMLSDQLETWYSLFLPTTLASETDQTPRIVYSYRNVFPGFAAKLTPDEAKAMEKKAGFISAKPDDMPLHTTHTTIEFKGTITGDRKSPTVADFSARGPNYESQGILKPDVVGPGVNILAAWPNLVANNNTRSNYFEMISGTSVSCPHLSGVAALTKSAHPDWSAAAIKSAIMTSADVMDRENHPIMDEEHLPADVFAVGAGHVNPARASDPGLNYDIAPDDYIPYLCGLNYTSREVSRILLRRAHCSAVPIIHEGQLNYPSFAIRLGSPNQTFTRTVTNVGVAVSSYNVEVVAPHGISVVVTFETLNFTRLNEKSTYEVSFRGSEYVGDTFDSRQGYILWKSAKHSVRIPIAAFHL